MEIKLLSKGYKNNEQFYEDFLNDTIESKDEYFSEDTAYIKEAPDFPIYMAYKNDELRMELFLKAFETVGEHYLTSNRELHMDEQFWHSLLILKKRDFLLKEYPQIAESIRDFNNIVLKSFDWENYIYKVVIGAEYMTDLVKDKITRQHYYELIVENLDLYNYMIKYEIFRSPQFIFNILTIVDELGLSSLLKKKITWRDDLSDDPRVGRQVLLEFNKSYPIVMSPMLEKEELKEIFMEYLSYYVDTADYGVLV